MPQYKAPDPDSFVAAHPATGARLYAHLGECPLYVNARLLPAKPGEWGRRKSFHLGYVIRERRLTYNWALAEVPEDLKAWTVAQLAAIYPSVEEAAGLTREEVAELVAEQGVKKAKHAKQK